MQLPKAKVGKIEHLSDGQVTRMYSRRDGRVVGYTICCDCGLTHLEELVPRKGYIRLRVWRDDRLTKRHRGNRRVVGRRGRVR